MEGGGVTAIWWVGGMTLTPQGNVGGGLLLTWWADLVLVGPDPDPDQDPIS